MVKGYLAMKNDCLILLCLLLVNWYSANGLTNNTNLTPAKNNIFSLGGTYDTTSTHPTNTTSCLNAAYLPDTFAWSNQHASLTFDSSADSEAVGAAIGGEIAARIGWGGFSSISSYHYARSSQDDSYTLNMNYVYQYGSKLSFKEAALVYGIDVLTAAAKDTLLNNPSAFRQKCGDVFISNLHAGLAVLMKVSLVFHSHSEKDAFVDKFDAAPGLSSIMSKIKFASSGINYSLSIAGMQQGGNPESLTQLFVNYGARVGEDGYPILNCGNAHNINLHCTDLITQVLSYATTVPLQLRSFNDYYLSAPTVEPWRNLGVFPQVLDPDPQILQAMRELAIQYDQDLHRVDFLKNYTHMLAAYNLISPDVRSKLSWLISAYSQVLENYIDPANTVMDCYAGFVSQRCVAIRDHIFHLRSNILNNIELNNFLSYLLNNQYSMALLKSASLTNPFNRVACDLNPISAADTALYLVNCQGQVSSSFDAARGF